MKQEVLINWATTSRTKGQIFRSQTVKNETSGLVQHSTDMGMTLLGLKDSR